MSDGCRKSGAGSQMGRLLKAFAHLVQRRIRLSARLRLRKRIKHLQWAVSSSNSFSASRHTVLAFLPPFFVRGAYFLGKVQ
jgi:hypothetical protein